VLVDSGSPSDFVAIRRKLAELQVDLRDLALIVHTHIHSDHIGCTAAIVAESKCPVAYHPADQPLAKLSSNGKLRGAGLRGKIMSRFFSNVAFVSVEADVALTDGLRLDSYGIDATILCTPGHTPGSISILNSAGDAIIGDVIMGGIVGGNLFPHKPNFHYFADDMPQTLASLDTILAQTSGTLYVGHGGPLAHADVAKWRGQQLGTAEGQNSV
jgi:glyoxylase-like metal-dependent hydrolase (beta-lactamase superfamily II)